MRSGPPCAHGYAAPDLHPSARKRYRRDRLDDDVRYAAAPVLSSRPLDDEDDPCRGARLSASRPAAAVPVGGWPAGLAVLHILLASACGGSLIFQRSLVAGDRFDKDECATTYPFAHSSHSRTPRSRADPQDSAAPHSLSEERMCNPQARTRPGVPQGPLEASVAQNPKPARTPGGPR